MITSRLYQCVGLVFCFDDDPIVTPPRLVVIILEVQQHVASCLFEYDSDDGVVYQYTATW